MYFVQVAIAPDVECCHSRMDYRGYDDDLLDDKMMHDQRTRMVYKYTNHKAYKHDPKKRANRYDITIIELAEDILLTKYNPACLAFTSDTTIFDKKYAKVYGENNKL